MSIAAEGGGGVGVGVGGGGGIFGELAGGLRGQLT